MTKLEKLKKKLFQDPDIVKELEGLYHPITKRNIILNSIKTPDGTVLISRHVHDYQSHVDANGETYIVDGGNDYLRRSENKEPFQELSLYSDEPFKTMREHIVWGTYGKNVNEPLEYKPIKDLTTDHIEAILETQQRASTAMKCYLLMELNFRD